MIVPFRSPRLRSVNRPLLLSLTGAGLFLASLDAYVVVTALIPMLKSVNIAVNRPEQATPIITGFLLGYLAVMPIAGGLSDRFGRLRLFAVSLGVFAFGSFLTATAPSLSQLVTGRVLQGAGGGALVPAVLALAADLYPAGDRSPVLGAISALQEIGSVLGPLWGGLVTASSFGWTWIFWINIPFAAFLLWALWPEMRAGAEPGRPAALDWLGTLLATAGLVLLTLALYSTNPEQRPVGDGFVWQLPLAIVCFGLFVWHERRTRNPLINVRRFADSAFTGSVLTNAIAGAGLMVALIYVPLLANAVFEMNASSAALLLLRLMVGIPIGALLGGFLAERLRSYRLVAALGLLLAAAGFLMLSGWDENSLKPHLFGPLSRADGELLLAGLGLGLEIAPVSAALLDAVSEMERGAGASFLIMMRLVGMLVGFSLVAGFSLWEFHRATAHLIPPLPGLNPNFATQYAIYVLKVRAAIFDQYHLVFRAAAATLFVGALVAALTLRPLARPRWR
jgi:MFS family permease